jgi:hypothetical protein
MKKYRVSPNSAAQTCPMPRKVYHDSQQTTSDNSDYGELRAIVERIEMRQQNSDVKSRPTNLLTNNFNSKQQQQQQQQQRQQQPVLWKSSPIVNKKKPLVFDYVPTSVMMKK